MNQKVHTRAIFFLMVFILTYEQLTARVLPMDRGQGEAENLDVSRGQKSTSKMENNDSANELMGQEECENGDNECFDRRVLADAHLDYIYTQQHKP